MLGLMWAVLGLCLDNAGGQYWGSCGLCFGCVCGLCLGCVSAMLGLMWAVHWLCLGYAVAHVGCASAVFGPCWVMCGVRGLCLGNAGAHVREDLNVCQQTRARIPLHHGLSNASMF